MAQKDLLGKAGEELAAQFLEDAGYTVLDRNWHCRHGEIDLIVCDGAETAFVEVKTRRSVAYGHPFEAISAAKMGRMRRLAALWCEVHPGAPAIRLDAIAIIWPRDAAPSIEHLKGVH
ncbi:YraN family protein [Salinibacterium sp. ZJ450]|uniref:YraN family protein n=1 Tax=Salinibacterium sp. ZJ450 TaxID=2708338 RepID=UPI00141E067E|nr:YraN family protein [Salinibacterium sp. ZJ450]